ncbi:N-acetyltransferase [Sphingobium lactosutens]|uniref:N-acetyltransferase n=1 Tax=Sphingobium lactosutens TaxID=522773 RepID=UPI0015BD07EF|nr:N-acetyltransferase [Sphingobium lactosutens]NWK99177.1 N-acetyltransferase [Sphingobium lactosutens]
MSRQLRLTKFSDLSLADPFFDSLKAGYKGFPQWFESKANEPVYAVIDDQTDELSGMIYLKQENGPVTDVEPPLPDRLWLKVGTLKIEGKGTRLGERVIKKIFDTAIGVGAEGVYVTVFELHEKLIELFKRYGFVEQASKTTNDGIEKVLVRSLTEFAGDRLKDYPFVHRQGKKAWLLAIYPAYHTRLLPDSILKNEPIELIQDVSHTNTIHKVYIGRLSLGRMAPGDIVIFYRTSDKKGPAYFRSVVSSICVVEEVRAKKDFVNVEAFLAYTMPRSVFSEEELRDQWTNSKRLYVAKMTYNAAFEKRTTRGQLLGSVISEQPRWDFRALTSSQLDRILELGEVNARLIVD